jgi:hypothetical protein
MLHLIFLQTTGTELPQDSTAEQGKELITVAMRGRCILLILDDTWVRALVAIVLPSISHELRH